MQASARHIEQRVAPMRTHPAPVAYRRNPEGWLGKCVTPSHRPRPQSGLRTVGRSTRCAILRRARTKAWHAPSAGGVGTAGACCRLQPCQKAPGMPPGSSRASASHTCRAGHANFHCVQALRPCSSHSSSPVTARTNGTTRLDHRNAGTRAPQGCMDTSPASQRTSRMR